MRRRAAAPAALAVALLVLALAPSAGAQALFGSCPKGSPEGARCGHVVVPLDRSGAVPGQISLFVETLPTSGGGPGGVLIPLSGGPGQSAVPLAGDAAQLLGPALGVRQLVTFDQRGTGRSGVLRCPELERRTGDDPRDYARCAQELGAARAFYTSVDSAEDIEAVRQALGVDRVSLYAVSYGTKVALAYAQRHPAQVDRLVLDSVVAPEGPDPFSLSTIAASRRVLGELCGAEACTGITPDPVADLGRLIGFLRANGSVSGPLVDKRGRTRRRTVSPSGVFNTLVEGDLDPTMRAEMPSAVRSFFRRDAAPLVRLVRRASGIEANPPVQEFSEGLFAATSCEETPFPWDRGAPLEQRPAQATQALASTPDSAFVPFDRATALDSPLLKICALWPFATAAPSVQPQPLPEEKTLILAGRDDLRTPLEDAQSVGQRIPGARLAAIPQTGHSVLGSDLTSCSQRALNAFFRDLPESACSAGRRLFPPTPVAPLTISEIPPAPGMHGNPGRVASAFGFTLADAERQAIAFSIDLASNDPSPVVRGGGLRGGHFTLTSRDLALNGYEYLGGLPVTAHVGRKKPTRLRVRGRYAQGILVVHQRGLITGRLNGQKVRYRVVSGYRLAEIGRSARAAAATLARTPFGGDLRPPRPLAGVRGPGGGLPPGAVSITPLP